MGLLLLAMVAAFFYAVPPTALQQASPEASAVVSYEDADLPDFSSYRVVDEKKSAFFNFILPLVQQENQRIARQRQRLASLQSQVDTLTGRQLQWLNGLGSEYQLAPESWSSSRLLEELLLRVDQVPPSLALAQSANESAWGTSRFAVQGNNLFGQWCYNKGCGLVPANRPDDASHEVAIYRKPGYSVASYIRNLNTNPAYRSFREIRAQQREQAVSLSGTASAMGLLKYSSRGQDYVNEIQSMIRLNQLDQYDSI